MSSYKIVALLAAYFSLGAYAVFHSGFGKASESALWEAALQSPGWKMQDTCITMSHGAKGRLVSGSWTMLLEGAGPGGGQIGPVSMIATLYHGEPVEENMVSTRTVTENSPLDQFLTTILESELRRSYQKYLDSLFHFDANKMLLIFLRDRDLDFWKRRRMHEELEKIYPRY